MKEERFREILKEEFNNSINSDSINKYIKQLELENKNLKEINKQLELELKNKTTDITMNRTTFCYNLNKYSRLNNISITQMAKKLNLSVSTVHDWYTGVNFPKLESLTKISNALDIPIQYLFIGE